MRVGAAVQTGGAGEVAASRAAGAGTGQQQFIGVSDGLLLRSGRCRRSVCLEPADGRPGPGVWG